MDGTKITANSFVVEHLKRNKYATLEEIKELLKTTSTMTVFRRLKKLNYLSSYSHRGKYYTLHSIADFNEFGLWNINSVCFSKYGNSVETVREFVEQSKAGLCSREIAQVMKVEVKHSLLKLFKQKRLYREKFGTTLVYFSVNDEKRKQQKIFRKSGDKDKNFCATHESGFFKDELKAAVILFYSLLNEKQRRLYAGLESVKFGHGGDKKVAELLGLTAHTVAKGRRELLGETIHSGEGIRKKGGGRKPTEKKFLK